MAYKKFDQEPWWPTQVEKRFDDVIRSVDNKVWMYRKCPLGPVTDAVSDAKMLQVGEPLERVLADAAALAGPTRANRRRFDKGAYRNVHILMVNVPKKYKTPSTLPTADYLDENFSNRDVARRILLVGIELRPQTGGGNDGLKGVIDSIQHTIFEGGTPMSDYDKDRDAVDALFSRNGFKTPTDEDFLLANAWWNKGTHADVPYLPHGDHMHMFSSATAAESAKRLQDDNTPCEEWKIDGSHTLAMSTVEKFDLPYVSAVDPRAHWGAALIEQNAVCISIRGALEPASVTRQELRRHRKNYTDDIAERVQNGKMERAEQQEMLNALTQVENHYATAGPPTLCDMSVTVVTTGRHKRYGFDPKNLGEQAGLVMDGMLYRQEMAFVDTMIASPVRANPHLHDLPITAVAYSGLPTLSMVGDRPRGALIGFTENDNQPAWMDHMAAVDEDSAPIALVVGQTGSGKSVLMQWLADQYARTYNDNGERTPVVMIDLKTASDFSPTVQLTGGKTYSLDSLLASDGVFDPFRFALSTESAVDMAHSLIMSVNPFGSRENRENYETPLRQGLMYGAENGAKCSGQALEMAAAANINPDIHDILLKINAAMSPMFRAICGFDPDGEGLRASGGITYIRIGDNELALPEGIEEDKQNSTQRTTLALVRAMIYGSIHALAGRQGVVLFDEGWIFLSAGKAEMERVGRLARSQQVFPIIFTQRTKDALKAELEGYISRGLLLPITDEIEAKAGFKLFKLQENKGRLKRIMDKATIGDEDGGANWDSFRALFDRDDNGKRILLRGTVGLYIDLKGRAVPTVIDIPAWFVKLASTTREDVRERSEELKKVNVESGDRDGGMGHATSRVVNAAEAVSNATDTGLPPGW